MTNNDTQHLPRDVAFSRIVSAVAAGDRRSIIKLEKYLRSDQDLGRGERNLLADLIRGSLTAQKRRGAKQQVSAQDRRAAVAEYVERTDNLEAAESVANEIYTRMDVRRSTFYQWVSEIRPVILQLETMGLPGTEIMKSR